MHRLRKKYWIRGAGIFLILSIFLFNAVAVFMNSAPRMADSKVTVVEEAIDATSLLNSHVICVHHPEGCPKDCLCPKLNPGVDVKSHQPLSGSVHEPYWVNCSEQGSIERSVFSSLFIPNTGEISLVVEPVVVLLTTMGANFAPNPCLAPPSKVPIS